MKASPFFMGLATRIQTWVPAMGIQILGRNRAEFGCLRLAWAYEQASSWPRKRKPSALA